MIAVLKYFGYALLSYIVVAMTAAGILAAVQERKIWAPSSLPSLSTLGLLKVFALNICWFVGCLIGVCIVLIKWILTLGKSDIAKDINNHVEAIVSGLVLKLFVGDVHVTGREHLPPVDTIPAPIYVANHASQIDVAAVYAIERRFKWISKQSVVYLPGVGQVMLLGGHVLIQRSGKNKKSVKTLFEKSEDSVQSGLPMFFFPQGTRKIHTKLPFKDGAFIVAQNTKAPLIPMSIEIPHNAWNSYYPLSLLWSSSSSSQSSSMHRPVVKITIHKQVPVTGQESRDALKQTCFDQIYSVLPKVTEDEKSK